MVTRRIKNLLAYLKSNVDEGLESMQDIQQSAKEIGDLSQDERRFLECAVQNYGNLERFSTDPGSSA